MRGLCFLKICFFYVMCMCTACMQVSLETRRRNWSSWTLSYRRAACGFWEANLGPLYEQQVFLPLSHLSSSLRPPFLIQDLTSLICYIVQAMTSSFLYIPSTYSKHAPPWLALHEFPREMMRCCSQILRGSEPDPPPRMAVLTLSHHLLHRPPRGSCARPAPT